MARLRPEARSQEFIWERQKLPDMFTYRSPASGDREEMWARKSARGWYVVFAKRTVRPVFSGTGTTRDRAARDMLCKRAAAQEDGHGR